MIVKLLTEHHLEFLSLKGGCRGSSESTHVKMPHCWKCHAKAHIYSYLEPCVLMAVGTEGGPTMEIKKEEDQEMSEVKKEDVDQATDGEGVEGATTPSLKVMVEEELLELQQENRRLHNLVTDLHKRHHQQTLQVSQAN